MSRKELVYEIVDPNSKEQIEALLKNMTVEKLRTLHIENRPER